MRCHFVPILLAGHLLLACQSDDTSAGTDATTSGTGIASSSTSGLTTTGRPSMDGSTDDPPRDLGVDPDVGMKPALVVLDELKAFPTAEGYGAQATGGRGGEILYVTTTEDTGEAGSLRWALQQDVPRIIYFLVGGTFELNSALGVTHGDFTLAGETAHELGGVNIRARGPQGYRLIFENVENFIIRYVSCEGGWESYAEAGQAHNPFGLYGVYNGILDHYTGGWSAYTGGTASLVHAAVGRGGRLTTQRSLLHEGVSGHNVSGVGGIQMDYVRNNFDPDQHAEIWAAWDGFSNHHNAFIGLTHRFFNTSGNGEIADQVYNNYVYGWNGRMSRHTNGNQPIDIYANVYEAAPYNVPLDYARMHKFDFNPYYNLEPPIPIEPAFFIEDNLIIDRDGSLFQDIGDDNWPMLSQFSNSPYGTTDDPVPQTGRRDGPSAPAQSPIWLHPVESVKDEVLSNCGAGVRFAEDGTPFNVDPVDMRYLEWALRGIGPDFISQSLGDGGLGDGATFVLPEYPSLTRDPAELDADGVPRTWSPPDDVVNDAGYSRLELYLADIAGDFHVLRAR